MQHFYDGQIRRYLTQVIRVFSNFVVRYGDGTLHRIPVMYGDADRQVASILRGNSENKVNSTPRIAVYISGLDIDRERLMDASFVSKVHIRERDIVDNAYTQSQGKNYTVERLMPTPFKLTFKVDIWSANADQKLQILEQILVLFNPSLELQTNSNFIDWTAISVLNLNQINWSSRQVPVGNDSAIDIATLTMDTPIFISPPAKVKHLGVITQIVNSLFGMGSEDTGGYIDGLGFDIGGGTVTMDNPFAKDAVTIGGFDIEVYNGQAAMLDSTNFAITNLEQSTIIGHGLEWHLLFDQHPGKYVAGSSKIYLLQPSGQEVSGIFAINELDPSLLQIEWDQETYNVNTGIDSLGRIEGVDVGYDGPSSLRWPADPGTFDAIIDPTRVYPGHGMQNVVAGDRFLIVEDIGSIKNADGPSAWKSTTGEDLIAKANDIIEWDGNKWNVIFDSNQNTSTMVYQTNIYNNIRVQYLWNGVSWAKSFEGEYKAGTWRIVL